MSEPQRIVYVERPRSHGCLWGCMGVLLIVALPLVMMWGYGAWFLYRGFKESPMMRTAIELTQHDGLAQRVLGTPITVDGVDGNAFSFVPGVGAHTEGAKAKIDTMVLTGPDGQRYDLLHHAPVPADGGEPI
jgi:hypothetical protein